MANQLIVAKQGKLSNNLSLAVSIGYIMSQHRLCSSELWKFSYSKVEGLSLWSVIYKTLLHRSPFKFNTGCDVHFQDL